MLDLYTEAKMNKVKLVTFCLKRQREYLEMSPYYIDISPLYSDRLPFCTVHELWKASFCFGRTNYVCIFLRVLFTVAVGC